MERHFVRIEDGQCEIDGADGTVTIGCTDAIVDAIGGEEYVLEYDEQAASTPWLSTDADGRVTVDVRSAIEELPLPGAVYDELSGRSPTSEDGPSDRIQYFAAVLRTIWDAKGAVEPEDLVDVGSK